MDIQREEALTMKSREPVFEKSRSVEDLDHMRLMALLRELVRDKGVMQATQALGVDYKTLTVSLRRGRLSRRMRRVLEKALLEGGGSPAAEQRERNDELEERLKEMEGRLETQGKDASKGFAAVKGEVKTLRDEQAQGFRQVERRLAQLEGGSESKHDEAQSKMARGTTKRTSAPWRKFPDLLTLEPAEGDEEVFGDAWSLVVQWRELRTSHPNGGKGLAWLRDEERLLAMELSLLEEHRLTLPPEKQPLRDFARDGQITWRRTALHDTRRALKKREILLRIFTLGLRPR